MENKKISQLDEDLNPSADDYTITVDRQSGHDKKVQLNNLIPPVGAMLKVNNLSDVSNAALAFGNIKQTATFNTAGVLRQSTYNVLDYGLVADGVTDNFFALSALINTVSSAGGTLYFPSAASAYAFASSNTPLVLPSNVHLDGAGYTSHLLLTGTTNHHFFVNANTSTVGNDNIWISNLRITGNQPVGYPDPPGGDQITILFNGVSHGIIENCTFEYGGTQFNCLTTYANTATCLTNGHNAYNRVSKCFFDNTCLVGPTMAQVSHSIIDRNITYGQDSPIAVLGTWDDVEVIGNEVYGQSVAGQGIEATFDTGDEKAQGLRIIGNYTNNAFHDGIHVQGGSGTTMLEDVIIMGNTIVSAGQSGIRVAQNVRGLKVIGNNIYNTQNAGVFIISDVFLSEHHSINDNHIYNAGLAAASNPFGILLEASVVAGGTVQHVVISGNNVYDTQGSATTLAGLKIITGNAGDLVDDIIITGNDFNSLATPYSTGGPGTISNISAVGNPGISSAYVDLTSSQNVGGAKTFTSTIRGQGDDNYFGTGLSNNNSSYIDVGSLGSTTKVWLDARSANNASVDMEFRTKGSGQFIFATGNLNISDALNLVLGTSTGTKIGTAGGASGQKLGFYNQTPIVQPLLATGAAHSVDDVITVLQNLGLVRQS